MQMSEQEQDAIEEDTVTGGSCSCFFRIGMELGLAQQWQRGLADLYQAVQSVVLETGLTKGGVAPLLHRAKGRA